MRGLLKILVAYTTTIIRLVAYATIILVSIPRRHWRLVRADRPAAGARRHDPPAYLQKTVGWFGGYGFKATMGYLTIHVGAPWIFAFLAILAESLGA